MPDWLARLQPGGLPVYRRTKATLARLSSRRDRLTAREIALEIYLDPFATLAVIHTVAARGTRRFDTEVTTVEHALMMQGIGAYLEAAQGLPVLEDTAAGRDAKASALLQQLTRRAQHAAWQARDFAVLHSDIHAEEVEVAAILHHVPEMLLWLRAPAAALELKRQRRKAGTAVEAETAALGMSLQAFRRGVLEAWHVPGLIRDLLDDTHTERPRQIILKSCLAIAELSERGWWDEGLMEHYLALGSVENAPVETVIATVHGNAPRVARACDWLQAPAAATWGPMIPGPWPQDEEEEAPAPQPAPPPPTSQVAAQPACPVPNKAAFSDAMKGIEAHLDGSYNLNQMSVLILKGLHTGLGLSRIVFAMVTPDGERVRTRFSLGIPQEDPLRQFDFPLAGKDLFAQLMGKMQGVWLSETNRERLWPMVDPKLQKLIGSGDFYAMSLHAANRPVGLIYADRGHAECALDPLTYTDFKLLCLQAARGLGKIRR